jgi:DNA polymerase III subunit delta
MDSLAFLDRSPKGQPQPVYVAHGDEDLLRREVQRALRRFVLESDDADFGLTTFPGDRTPFASVHDELATMPFVGSRRLVVVENADPFVTAHRAALEKYVSKPSATGVLILDVKSWPANTRLAKLVPAEATLVCKAPPTYKLPDWCVQWAGSRHGKQLAAGAAKLLVDLIGADMGVLDQELAKLAVYVGDAPKIEARDVDRLVGRSRAENTWIIFEAMASGKPADSLAVLDRLFDQGEDAMRILGAFSLQLRRLAQAHRLHQQGRSLAAALEAAGVPPFAVKGCEGQMRHLGQRRLDRLYEWLLEVDQGLKGGSQLPSRVLLERLVVRLAVPPQRRAQ